MPRSASEKAALVSGAFSTPSSVSRSVCGPVSPSLARKKLHPALAALVFGGGIGLGLVACGVAHRGGALVAPKSMFRGIEGPRVGVRDAKPRQNPDFQGFHPLGVGGVS